MQLQLDHALREISSNLAEKQAVTEQRSVTVHTTIARNRIIFILVLFN